MGSMKTLFLSVCLIFTTSGSAVPKAENVRWVSLDFKTVLFWTAKASDAHAFTVTVSRDDGDWMDIENCYRITETHCDLTMELRPFDRSYVAKIQTEPDQDQDQDQDPGEDVFIEDYPFTKSPPFIPVKQSNISAVNFTVELVGGGRALVNITDLQSGYHEAPRGHLTIRDILKNLLKYKISYYKSGNTGKRDVVSDSSSAVVSGLDAGDGYCFMVAAFIPTRPSTSNQLGAWSIQQCVAGDTHIAQDLTLGAWLGAIFSLLLIIVIVVTVTVFCCRHRNSPLQQQSAPI